MNITPGRICTTRGCTSPATHLTEVTFQNRVTSHPKCEAHYLILRRIDENFDRWLDNYLG